MSDGFVEQLFEGVVTKRSKRGSGLRLDELSGDESRSTMGKTFSGNAKVTAPQAPPPFCSPKHHNRLFGEDPLYVEKLAAAERGNSWQYDDNAKNTVLLNEETEEKRTSVLNVLDDLMHAEVIDEVTAALEAARNKGGKTSSRSSTEATNELQAHNSALKHEFQKPFPIDQPGPFADTPT